MSGGQTIRAKICAGHEEQALEVPFDPAQRWGVTAQPLWSGRRGAVRAILHGEPFDTVIVSRSKRYRLLLPAAAEVAAGVCAGDAVERRMAPRSCTERRCEP